MRNVAFIPVIMRAAGASKDVPETVNEGKVNTWMAIEMSEIANEFIKVGVVVNTFNLTNDSAIVASNYFEGGGKNSVVDLRGLAELIFSGNYCSLSEASALEGVHVEAGLALVLSNNVVNGLGCEFSVGIISGPGLTAVGNVVHPKMKMDMLDKWLPMNTELL